MKNDINNLKDINSQIKKQHNDFVNEHEMKITNSRAFIYEWKTKKKIKWWGWLLIIGITGILTGLSFLIGWAFRDNPMVNTTNNIFGAVGWTAITITGLCLIIATTLTWIRNRKATNFYNDKRRRYQKTFEPKEAQLLMWRNITTWIFLLMCIVSGLTLGLI